MERPIGGKRQYPWRAVDQDDDVIDILVQGCSPRFFQEIAQRPGISAAESSQRLRRSYQAALREVPPSLAHITDQYENNRTEVSHQPGRQQERRCADLNRQGRHGDSFPFMDS